ncbi:MAG: hypothetical protein D6822_03065, partial [Cyanobacteria bacterium J149]
SKFAYEELVSQLTDVKPIARLIAVKKLTRFAQSSNCLREEVIEYFSLMLAEESEMRVRAAIWQGLQILNVPKIKTRVQKPLRVPLQSKVRQKY